MPHTLESYPRLSYDEQESLETETESIQNKLRVMQEKKIELERQIQTLMSELEDVQTLLDSAGVKFNEVLL